MQQATVRSSKTLHTESQACIDRYIYRAITMS